MTERDSLNALLARNVRACMWERHLTQQQLATRTGVDVRTIRRMLYGHGATVEMLDRVAGALQVEAATLLQKVA